MPAVLTPPASPQTDQADSPPNGLFEEPEVPVFEPEPVRMTLEEFLALPDGDGVERELIRGELKERPMTMRSRIHFLTESKLVLRIGSHLEASGIDAEVGSGEAGVILNDLHSGVGIDVVVLPNEMLAKQNDRTRMFSGVPLMTVEILSTSDQVGNVNEKVRLYMDAGVKLAWVVDPTQRTITAYRPGEPPAFFSGEDTVTAAPVMPDFAEPLPRLFPSASPVAAQGG